MVEKVIEEENLNLRGRKKRMAELAAQLKEKGKGSVASLNKILNKFSIEEGIRIAKAKEYLHSFECLGLVKIEIGQRKWKYNPKAEWDLFHIEI